MVAAETSSRGPMQLAPTGGAAAVEATVVAAATSSTAIVGSRGIRAMAVRRRVRPIGWTEYFAEHNRQYAPTRIRIIELNRHGTCLLIEVVADSSDFAFEFFTRMS